MLKLLLCTMTVIVIICGGYGYFVLNYGEVFANHSFVNTGAFGDSWGALTSIFSALGFCGILITLKQQSDSMIRFEEDSKKREKSEKIRDFENSFFNMLNLLQVIINDMKTLGKNKESVKVGRAVFVYYYNGFKTSSNHETTLNLSKNFNSGELALESVIFSDAFESYFTSRSANFSHYYRFLYNMFKFITEADVPELSKKKYTSILRAQISNYELLILLYNGNSTHGVNFSEYFEKYAIFDNLPVDKLINPAHVLLANKKAWGNNKAAMDIYNKYELL